MNRRSSSALLFAPVGMPMLGQHQFTTYSGGGTRTFFGDQTIGGADAGRLWGGNQRLPFAPSRWGTFSDTYNVQGMLSGKYCSVAPKFAHRALRLWKAGISLRIFTLNSPH